MTPIRAAHVPEMRQAAYAARTALGLPVPAYTDPVLLANQTVVRAIHVQQLRERVK